MKQPKSTAATTAFCAAQITGVDGRVLHIDGNQKITAGNGTFDDPKPNAFSLAHIEDCPGATKVCKKSCYVHGLKKHAPAVYDLYAQNSATIREILADDATRVYWAGIMAEWITENCPGGFRWHVSGDLFSQDYAFFVWHVCLNSPLVEHWIYTRSFDLTSHFEELDNLQLMVSLDSENLHSGLAVLGDGLSDPFRGAYLTSDGAVPESLPKNAVIFPDYSLRGDYEWLRTLSVERQAQVCPVDFYGKSEETRCGVCRKCLP